MLPPLAPLVLYRDRHIVALNKPAGILVHPVAADSLSLADGLAALADDNHNIPFPMHRLDRETSGCLLLGYTPPTRQRFEQFFRHHQIEKTYWAVVQGLPPEASGVIDLPLLKHQPSRRMVVDPAGSQAVTAYKVLGSGQGLSWLELSPRTGRTHQLRAHCRAMGCPIVGDTLYHDEPVNGPMQLHAHQLAFTHITGEMLTITAPPALHMAERLAGFSCPTV